MNGTPGPVCVCGHTWSPHEHYRAGTECALCQCPSYTRKRWWRRSVTWPPR